MGQMEKQVEFDTLFSIKKTKALLSHIKHSFLSYIFILILMGTLSSTTACGSDASGGGNTTPTVPDTTKPTVDVVDVNINNILTVYATDNESLDQILVRIDTNKDDVYSDETEIEYTGQISVDKIARDLGIGYNESFNFEVSAKDISGNCSAPVYSSFTTKTNTAPSFVKFYEKHSGQWEEGDGVVYAFTEDILKYRVEFTDGEFTPVTIAKKNLDQYWPSLNVVGTVEEVLNAGDICYVQDPDNTGNMYLFEVVMSTNNVSDRFPPYGMSDEITEESPDAYTANTSTLEVYIMP